MADNRHLEHHPGEQRPLDLNDPSQRHEHQDVNIWAVTKAGIGIALTTIASIFIVLAVFRYLAVREQVLPPAQPTGVNVDARRLPPEPRLIENEPQNLLEYRTAENQILNSYGWADQKHTVVKLPIDRAIDLLVARGLPARPQNGPQSEDHATVPTASALGSIMQPPGGPLASQLAAAQGAGTQGK
jgi:hypothetical protein